MTRPMSRYYTGHSGPVHIQVPRQPFPTYFCAVGFVSSPGRICHFHPVRIVAAEFFCFLDDAINVAVIVTIGIAGVVVTVLKL